MCEMCMIWWSAIQLLRACLYGSRAGPLSETAR
jgi:hypothetical protein